MTDVNVLAQVQNILLTRGTDNKIQFRLRQGKNAGDPFVDISLDTVTLVVNEDIGGAAAIPTKTNLPVDHDDPTNGGTTFTILRTEIDDETSADFETSWAYEIRRIEPSGDQRVYITGDLRICPAVQP